MLINDLYFYVFEGRAIIQPDTLGKRIDFIEKRQHKIRDGFRFITEAPSERYQAFFYLLSLLDTDSTKALRGLLYSEEECIELLKRLEEIQNQSAFQYAFPSEDAIKQQFHLLNQTFKYFSEEEAVQAENEFLISFKACKLIADFVECNNSENNGVAYEHAYKLLVICGLTQKKQPLLKRIDSYLKAHGKGEKPLHDALVQAIPVNEPALKDLSGWRKFIHRYGYKALGIYEVATEIEKFLAGKAPITMVEAEEAASKIIFPRANEYPTLARLCKQYHMPENIFNQCLDIEEKRKKRDKLPNIHIDGQELGFPGYHLIKLPIDDPRAYLLGKITRCCQSIGGDSEDCVIDGITRESNGFYVLLKGKTNAQPVADAHIDYANFTIVGQGYAWLTTYGNMTIDSWENLRPEADDQVIVPLLEKFAQRVIDAHPSIIRITIGLGGKTPSAFKDTEVKYTETIFEGLQYNDSIKQGLVYSNELLLSKLISQFFDAFQLTPPFNADPERLINAEEIYSIKQVEVLNHLFTKPEAAEVWIKLLGEPANEDDIEKLAKSSYEFWESLYYLKEFNLLTTDTLTSIITQKEYVKLFSRAAISLEKNNLLDADNLFILINNIEFSVDIADSFVELKKAGILTDKIRMAVSDNAVNAGFFKRTFIFLNKANILTEHNCEFCNIKSKDISRYMYYINQCLAILSKLNQLSDFSFNAVMSNYKHSSGISVGLAKLNERKLLTDENIRIIALNMKDCLRICKNIITLHEAEIPMSDILLDILIRNKPDATATCRLLRALKKANILTDSTANLVMQSGPGFWRLEKDAVTPLEKAGALTVENFEILAKESDNCIWIAEALISLHHNNLLTDTNRKAIITRYPTWAANGIIQLHKANLLTDENREFILCKNGDKAQEISLCLVSLTKANILTPQNKFRLLKGVKYHYFPKILSLLDNAEPSLLTEKNFLMLVEAIISSEIVSSESVRVEVGFNSGLSGNLDLYDVLNALNEAEILTQLNYEAIINFTNKGWRCQYHSHFDAIRATAQLKALIEDKELTNESFSRVPFIKYYFSDYNARIIRQEQEAEATNIVKNIKQYIITKTWVLHGVSPGKTIRIAEDKEEKVPSHVQLQWNEIEAADNGIKTYKNALKEIKRIGQMTNQSWGLFSLFRDKGTSAYYNLFEQNNQEEFDNTFKFSKRSLE